MVGNDLFDSEQVAAASRRMQEEAYANYVANTQEMERLSRMTVYRNVGTGEISYSEPLSEEGESEAAASTATETVAVASPLTLADDPDAGARHVKIAISFVLVVILTWAWFAQRRAALQAARQSGG